MCGDLYMRIAVIDGQGGGIGKLIIEVLKAEAPLGMEVIALGTNALATSTMLKAGADFGASGENAIIFNVSRVDLILGPIGIVLANSMMGELTPIMAKAVSSCTAPKILLPLNKCGIEIIGTTSEPLPELVKIMVDKVVKSYLSS